MRLLLFLPALLSLLHLNSSGQKIDYSIPGRYEKDISKEDYRKIVDASVRAIATRYTIDLVKDGTVQLVKGQDMQAFNLHNLIDVQPMGKRQPGSFPGGAGQCQ